VCEIAWQTCLDVIHRYEVRVHGAMRFCKRAKQLFALLKVLIYGEYVCSRETVHRCSSAVVMWVENYKITVYVQLGRCGSQTLTIRKPVYDGEC